MSDPIANAADKLGQLYRDIAPRLRAALSMRGIVIRNGCPVTVADEADLPTIDLGLAGFIAAVRESRQLAVSSEFCSTAIYPQVTDNLWFRYVHDMGHMLYGCEFDYAGESCLHPLLWNWIETSPTFWALSLEEQRWVWCVYHADTQGQTDYFEETGEFPDDQAAFVRKHATDCYNRHFAQGEYHAQA